MVDYLRVFYISQRILILQINIRLSFIIMNRCLMSSMIILILNSTEDEFNIPYYVSNGYLVFVPDIHYKMGKLGMSALNAVVSAAVD